MSEWKPIDTAPRNHGDAFVAFDPDVGVYIAERYMGKFVCSWNRDPVSPTHWMPLPNPPKK